MRCGNCGAEFDASAMTKSQRDQAIEEMRAANLQDEVEWRSELPAFGVNRRGVWIRGRGLSRRAIACFVMVTAAFLLFDDVKWHALFPVAVALFWLFSCWMEYANDRDAAKRSTDPPAHRL